MIRANNGIGAAIGDMFGSPYEFVSLKSAFSLEEFWASHPDGRFREEDLSDFTDDTVLTAAVKQAVLDLREGDPDKSFEDSVRENLILYAETYPYQGYGERFAEWVMSEEHEPYGSYGNGSAMRVSPVAYASENIETVERLAELSAGVTHNSEEGVKGAKSIARAIYLLRNGRDRETVRKDISERFHYDLDVGYEEVVNSARELAREGKLLNETCQASVPQAFIAFFASESFEDAIVKAVAIGGDTDTLAAMAGSLAEAYYGVAEYIVPMAKKNLGERLWKVFQG